MRTALRFLALVALLVAAPLLAQDDARLAIVLPEGSARGTEAPAITTANVLEDRSLRELLHSGFPARLHYRLELWAAGGLFDDLRRRAEWDVIVRYDPLQRRYSATRIEGDRATSLGSYARLPDMEKAVGKPFQPALQPPGRHDRFYYVAELDVEMLSVNDLDEVERWLRGELSPAVRGERNPGTALGRGAKTLVTRLLGGEERHYQARSRVFRAP
ncbi:MAG TPA: hypothetical protein VFS44_04470 [Gemmatimonadaceae bacterium]|nr:hypothetical protein [Gemmatimonadaceae bacterium]